VCLPSLGTLHTCEPFAAQPPGVGYPPSIRRAAPLGACAGRGPSPPPRFKLALLTWAGVYPIITVILGLLGPELATWPLGLRTLVVSVLMVATLSWVVMPGLTRLLRPWLSPA